MSKEDDQRDAVASATQNVDHTQPDDPEVETRHTGWDRDDYDLEEIGEMEETPTPKSLDRWVEELNEVRERLADFPAARNQSARQKELKSVLEARERKIERYLEDNNAIGRADNRIASGGNTDD